MKNIFIVILFSSVIAMCLISCNSDKEGISSDVHPKPLYTVGNGTFTLDDVFPPIDYGIIMDMVNGWRLYFDPNYAVYPIPNELYYDEANMYGYEVNDKNGSYIYCPTDGKNCGKVYWYDPGPPGGSLTFIGYYLKD